MSNTNSVLKSILIQSSPGQVVLVWEEIKKSAWKGKYSPLFLRNDYFATAMVMTLCYIYMEFLIAWYDNNFCYILTGYGCYETSSWSVFSECSASCGGGLQTYQRRCCRYWFIWWCIWVTYGEYKDDVKCNTMCCPGNIFFVFLLISQYNILCSSNSIIVRAHKTS